MSTLPDVVAADAIRGVTDTEVADYSERGWALLPRLFRPDLVARVRSEIETKMGADASHEGADSRGDLMSPHLKALWQEWENPSHENEFLRSVARSPQMARVASRMLGGRAVRFYGDDVLCKLPASRQGSDTPWHQDFPYMAFDRCGVMTIWVALIDIPAEMGTMRFLSGSRQSGPLGRVVHLAGQDLVTVHPELLDRYEMSPPLNMKAGDATVHDMLTVHYAPENATDQPRWAWANHWFPADALYTGASQRRTNGLELTINQEFDHPHFPRFEHG
jgi:ectoine hydroxylase-related dioxygenase (phytanoyl-CoA dioxygenase family)